MANSNGRMGLTIGFSVSVLLAIGGWFYAGMQGTRTREVVRLEARTEETRALAGENTRDIAVINTKLDSILTTVREIKEAIK
ncbi:hypothetical protein ES703_52857 [subsurface metagenome]